MSVNYNVTIEGTMYSRLASFSLIHGLLNMMLSIYFRNMNYIIIAGSFVLGFVMKQRFIRFLEHIELLFTMIFYSDVNKDIDDSQNQYDYEYDDVYDSDSNNNSSQESKDSDNKQVYFNGYSRVLDSY